MTGGSLLHKLFGEVTRVTSRRQCWFGQVDSDKLRICGGLGVGNGQEILVQIIEELFKWKVKDKAKRTKLMTASKSSVPKSSTLVM